ncbi:MAG: rod shape-determining protein RodA [Lachnospiraceae bacterium]|nr:rod shape-determining protein RodA [Lachnospiraceae bacterium]
MKESIRLKDCNFLLIAAVVILNIIGILAIGSARPALQSRQISGMIAGLVVMVIVALIDYSYILKFYWVIYALNLVLLFSVELFGESVNNAKRWLIIPGINLQFQPSELAKILLILFFARFIMLHREQINTVKILAVMFILLAPILLLVKRQPDLSTTIMLAAIFCMLLFMGGLSKKIIIGVFAVVVPAASIILFLVLQPDQTLIEPYQQKRILAWLDPEEYALSDAWQTENSIMAIGSGELTGKGLNNNEVSSVINGNYVSEAETDFIFAVIGEEMGFIGCSSVIILIVIAGWCCFATGMKAKDLSGTLICMGIGTIAALQGFFNISVATGIMPNTGIPLPFVSYGLTSLVSNYMGIGFVLSAGFRKREPERHTTELGQIGTEIK